MGELADTIVAYSFLGTRPRGDPQPVRTFLALSALSEFLPEDKQLVVERFRETFYAEVRTHLGEIEISECSASESHPLASALEELAKRLVEEARPKQAGRDL